MNWIDVIDTAVKIGLGAAIAAVTSYFTIRANQNYAARQRNEERFYRVQDERKLAYVEFSSKSHSLIRKYTYLSCDPSNEEYSEYINLFNKVQILSEDVVRASASKTFNSVTEYIIPDKSSNGDKAILKLYEDLNSNARDSIAMFQKIAQLDGMKKFCN